MVIKHHRLGIETAVPNKSDIGKKSLNIKTETPKPSNSTSNANTNSKAKK